MAIGEFFADYDEESGLWCVFHTDKKTGHAYASYASEESAIERAKEMNDAAKAKENVETPLGEQIDGQGDEVEPETTDYWNDVATDAEADADVLRNAGMGTDEDYE